MHEQDRHRFAVAADTRLATVACRPDGSERRKQAGGVTSKALCHETSVGEASDVNPLVIDRIAAREFSHQRSQEAYIGHLVLVTLDPVDVVPLVVDAAWVNDDEAMLIGNVIEAGQLSHAEAVTAATMQEDDQWHSGGTVLLDGGR